MSKSAKPWVQFSHSPLEKIKLFCFPFAGGDIYTYRKWSEKLDDKIGVYAIQLPGRGARFNEALFRRLDSLIEELASQLVLDLQAPFVFFGHSLGGLIAFELTRFLKKEFSLVPQRLCISSSLPPQLYSSWHHTYHLLSDRDLLEKIQSFGGVPQEVLAHHDLLEMLLPIVRADMEILETYVFEDFQNKYAGADSKLHCPLHVMGAVQDTLILYQDLNEWQTHCENEFSLHTFTGDHFYLNSQMEALCQLLNKLILSFRTFNEK
ncbi:MAG: thioesterase [Deltaproteobacteria bacterium]|nr:thioesterase [Deltaproteobacteria bacterium]